MRRSHVVVRTFVAPPSPARRSKVVMVALAAMLACVLPGTRASAELLVGLTEQNLLISFDSATPGTVTTIGPVTGLTAGDTLVGIDRRPQALGGGVPGPNNGRLYALGVNAATGTGRVYTLSESTAAATLVATLASDPVGPPFTGLSGTGFGLDFNPVVDRLRVTSNTGQNLRINADTGLVLLDTPLAYASGDPNFGAAPIDVALAYSNNFGGAASTTLRGVDIGRDPDLLVVHTNPNAGTLQTAANLPFNSIDSIAYDVSGLTTTPYIAAGTGGSSALYANDVLVGTIGGGVRLRGLAAPVGLPVPEPASASAALLFATAALARRRRQVTR